MDKVQEVIGKVTGQPKLPTAKLGKNGPQVTRLGYGTMGLVSIPGIGDSHHYHQLLTVCSLERLLRHTKA
jgi:hypothetical protein